MNILYLHTHDTGRYIGAYGYPVRSPELDAFASGAAVMRNAHCAAPTCSPSRSALLTGTYPHENGMLGLAHRGFALHDYSAHLAPFLRARGYTTALCGVQHVAPQKEMIGYDLLLEAGEDYFQRNVEDLAAYDRANAERAARFLERPPEGPFFLSFGMLNTHRPFPPAAPGRARPVRPPAPVPDTPDTREDAAGFYSAVETADGCAGRVLDALARSGREEETLVLITTDHGPAFPAMKAGLGDDGTGVLLMLRLPDGSGAGRSFDAMVSQLDIFPTLCELLGTEPPVRLRGSSLLPLLRGEQESLHPYLFTETTFHAAYEPARAVRSARYKLIRHFSPFDRRLPVNVDDSPSKELFSANGYFEEPVGSDELYDLMLDPQEKRNRIAEQEYRQAAAELGEVLHSWMRETGDPLLQGHVSAPAGALVNSPHCYSPDSGEFEG
jgi:arylsulfatase A-like enzyme